MRAIYAIPADREFQQGYSDGIKHALMALQRWYRQQLGGPTFALYDTIPAPCQLGEPEAAYVPPTKESADRRAAWRGLIDALQACAPVRHGADQEFAWVIYADINEPCPAPFALGRGGSNLTMMGRWDLEGLTGAGQYKHCDLWAPSYGRWVGGAGHEIGHALGLAHPPGCNERLPTCDRDALMWAGYSAWPSTYLRDDDKVTLLRSPFIRSGP